MARTSLLTGFLEKIKTPQERRPDCWGIIKVEKMLAEAGVSDYEVSNEPRIIRLNDESALMKVMMHLVPSDVSSDYHLVLSKLDNEMKITIGSWQFESKA